MAVVLRIPTITHTHLHGQSTGITLNMAVPRGARGRRRGTRPGVVRDTTRDTTRRRCVTLGRYDTVAVTRADGMGEAAG